MRILRVMVIVLCVIGICAGISGASGYKRYELGVDNYKVIDINDNDVVVGSRQKSIVVPAYGPDSGGYTENAMWIEGFTVNSQGVYKRYIGGSDPGYYNPLIYLPYLKLTGINNDGTVVGALAEETFKQSGNTIQYYDYYSNSILINNVGTVVVKNYSDQLITYSSSGRQIIPLLSGYCGAEIRAINDAGTVLGDVYSYSDGKRHQCIWTSGVMSLLTCPTGYKTFGVNDINDSNVMAGWVSDGHSEYACYWDSAWTFHNLGVKGKANGINDLGQIVGVSNMGSFVYTDGSFEYLSGSDTACAINNNGTVLGSLTSYQNSVTMDTGCVWTTGSWTTVSGLAALPDRLPQVPEAGSLAGFLCGLLGFCGMRIKHKR